MNPRRRTAKLICGRDLHTFALMMALVIFLPFQRRNDIPDSFTSRNLGTASQNPSSQSFGRLGLGANHDDAIIVTVTRDGRIYFRAEQIWSDQLPAKIRERLSAGSEQRVYLRADARVRYDFVKPVLEAVQSAGVADVSILANE